MFDWDPKVHIGYIIALLALIVSIITLRYSKQAIKISKEALEINELNRLDTLAPRFDCILKAIANTRLGDLCETKIYPSLTNNSSRMVTDIRICICIADPMRWTFLSEKFVLYGTYTVAYLQPNESLEDIQKVKNRVEIKGDILSYGPLEKYLTSKWPRFIQVDCNDDAVRDSSGLQRQESFYFLSKERPLKFRLTYQYMVGEIRRLFSADYLLTPVFYPNERSLKTLEEIVGPIQHRSLIYYLRILLHRKQRLLKAWQGPTVVAQREHPKG